MLSRSKLMALTVLSVILLTSATHAGENTVGMPAHRTDTNFCKQQVTVCRQGDINCRILCRADDFEVEAPTDWTAKPDMSADLALHFSSSKSISTGGNCPIVSIANLDAKKSLTSVATSAIDGKLGRFWSDIFIAAGFKEFTGDALNWKTISLDAKNGHLVWSDHVTRPASWNKAWGYTHRDDEWWLMPEGAMYSMVEIIFQKVENGPVFRARQALYYIPGTVLKDVTKVGDGSKYFPDRIYFVNCTALDATVPSLAVGRSNFHAVGDTCEKTASAPSGFCQELENFNRVFSSFTPRRCYSPDPGSQNRECIRLGAQEVATVPPSENIAENVAVERQSQALIEAGALAAKLGL